MGKLHESDWSDFLFLKIFKKFGSGYSRCLHLWPGSLRACILNLNAFSWILALFLALLLFVNVFRWSLPFVLYWFMHFCPRNRQIGGAVFVIVKITAFCGVLLDVPCAMFCCFICSAFQCLAFHVQFCCCLIFLQWFWALLVWFFRPKPSLFAFLFVAGLPWCHFLGLRNFPSQILLLVVIRVFSMHPFGNDNLVCGVC